MEMLGDFAFDDDFIKEEVFALLMNSVFCDL